MRVSPLSFYFKILASKFQCERFATYFIHLNSDPIKCKQIIGLSTVIRRPIWHCVLKRVCFDLLFKGAEYFFSSKSLKSSRRISEKTTSKNRF